MSSLQTEYASPEDISSVEMMQTLRKTANTTGDQHLTEHESRKCISSHSKTNIYTSISIASISFTGRMKFIPQ